MFWVELPKMEAPVATADRASDQSNYDASKNPQTVLHIEDELSITGLVDNILARRPGIRTIAAMQGGLGLDLARQHHPAAILLDLDLPDIRGEEVLRQLQKDPETSDIPVLIISVVADAEHISRLLAAGARGYLPKPLDLPSFLSAIDEVLPVR